jgi:carbon monoxide dehydrogenase subunit G
MNGGVRSIAAPRSLVWSLIADPARATEVLPGLALVEVLSGEPRQVGLYVTRLHFRANARPRVIATEITELVPERRRVTRSVSGLFLFTSEYTLSDDEGASGFRDGTEAGTKLVWSGDCRLNGALAWLVAFLLLGIPALQAAYLRSTIPQSIETYIRAAERLAKG